MADKDEVLKEDDDKGGATEYVVIETPPNAPGAKPDEPPAPKVKDEPKGDDDEDDDEDGDERLAEGDQSDAEREALRERRRVEKKERREARRIAMDRDKRMLQSLAEQNQLMAQRLAQLEGRTFQQDQATIESRLSEAQADFSVAERLLKQAIADGNGDEVVRAMAVRDDARDRARQLTAMRQRAENARQAPQQQGVPAVDPRVKANAEGWMRDKQWYDPSGNDEDSAIVLAIDNRLASEGYDPKQPDYWRELDERVKRRLPHRFKAAETPAPDERPAGRRGPPVAGGREHAPPSTRREVYISPERKKALQEMGAWDDPAQRARFIKAYAEFDRNNPQR